MKTKVKIGYVVEAISGDDKGTQGIVVDVKHRPKNKVRIKVRGVAMVTKHVRRSEENPEGKLVKEDFIDVSNVKIISTKKPKR